MSATEPTAAPRRGRDIRRERAQKQAVKYPYIRRKLAPVELLSSESAEIIEANAETIMEEIGIEFRRDPESLKLWRDAGADVTGERVHLPRGPLPDDQRAALRALLPLPVVPARNGSVVRIERADRDRTRAVAAGRGRMG